ncbi:hypothetical protein BsWGS_28295 [Bradybaena similaris]
MMQPFHSFLCCLLVMFLLLHYMSLDVAAAGNKKDKSKAAACKYARAGIDSPCNRTTNTRVISMQLKRGSPTVCQATKLISKPCHQNGIHKARKVKGCRYERNGSNWTECDPVTNLMSKTTKLKEGSGTHCPLIHVRTKACGSNTNKKGHQRSRKGCVYNKQPWSDCNVDTKTRQREMILVRGEPSLCLPKKIVTKVCKKVCRFTKGKWGPCDTVTNLEQRSSILRKGDPAQCLTSVESRPCRGQAQELVAAKSNKCRYNLNEWSTCDLRSNTMTQWMTLKSGDPNVCQRSKKLTRKCITACKFRRGEWSECNELTLLMTRVDTLVKGSSKECDLTREITKKCKRVCKYTIGEWGQCDPVTNHRTRVKTLVSGNNFKKCQPEEIVTKPCTKKDGEERCFFGSWGDFGPCTNGVMTKHRPVLQGGLECERKGAVTKACDQAS